MTKPKLDYMQDDTIRALYRFLQSIADDEQCRRDPKVIAEAVAGLKVLLENKSARALLDIDTE